MRLLRRAFVSVLLVILVYLGAAAIGAVVPGSVSPQTGPPVTSAVLVSGPIHYDILLPLDADTRSAFAFLQEGGLPITHPDAAWLVVGWGSRAFYTATGGYQDLRAQTIWTAATGDKSVLRFDVLGQITLDSDWPRVALSAQQMALLRGAVLQELARDETGGAIPVPGAGLSEYDVFFEGRTGFSIFRTCNVWIGDVLRSAGVLMGIWTPTPYAVTLSRWWFS